MGRRGWSLGSGGWALGVGLGSGALGWAPGSGVLGLGCGFEVWRSTPQNWSKATTTSTRAHFSRTQSHHPHHPHATLLSSNCESLGDGFLCLWLELWLWLYGGRHRLLRLYGFLCLWLGLGVVAVWRSAPLVLLRLYGVSHLCPGTRPCFWIQQLLVHPGMWRHFAQPFGASLSQSGGLTALPFAFATVDAGRFIATVAAAGRCFIGAP